MSNLMRKPVLVLNASYEAIRIVPARRALTLICKGSAMVELPTRIEVYPGITLPSVIRLRTYRHIPIRLQIVTRKNIYLRDGHTCQYCGDKLKADELTLDHIIPKSRGGKSDWQNQVTCCKPCNWKKDDRTPEEWGVKLLHRPLPATVHTGRSLLRTMALETSEWERYLYADSRGETKLQFA
jgi:5-methylcytosine-specific restriction endonuclease McrA